MIAARAGTLSNDGKLTVTGDDVASGDIPSDIWGGVKSIEVTANASFTLNEGISFSGSITVLQWGSFYNYANLSGDVTVLEWGYFWNKNPVGKISGGAISGQVDNDSIITGGKFTGTVNNSISGSITGGDFTDATVENRSGASVTGGEFNGFKLENGVLTITGTVDLKEDEDALHPLTIGLDAENIQSITVAEGATFNAGNNAVDDPVTCNGTITGGTFTSAITGTGKLESGDFTAAYLVDFDGTVGAGARFNGYSIADGKLTVTGEVASGDIPPAIWNAVTSIEVTANASFNLSYGTSFSGNIHSADVGSLNIDGTISGGTITAEGVFQLYPDGEITGSANVLISEDVFLGNNGGTISGGTFTGEVRNLGTITGGDFTDATVTNSGFIKDGTFTGATVINNNEINGGTFSDGTTVKNSGSITGGDFKNATVTNEEDGAVSGGVFKNFSLKDGKLTITGEVDLSAGEDALAPLTIGLDAESIVSITVEADATFNAEGNTVDDPVTCNGTISGGTFTDSVTCNGKITGGTFKGAITGNGTLAGGDFSGADISGFDGEITGGTFDGYTISDTSYGRTLTITAKNFDLTKIDLKSFEVNAVVVAAGASVADADEKDLAGVPFVNYGEISGGTFAEILYLENNGTITGGTFNCRVNNVNDAIITGGTFNAYLTNLSSVTDAAINGTICNFPTGTITGCTFGDSASVEQNRGTIYVTMTVNGEEATFKHGEYILASLKAQFGEGDWHAVAGEEQETISEDATFGLQKKAYACAHYTKDNELYISAPTAVTEDMLADVKGVFVTATGEITGGTFTASLNSVNVQAGGKISGGTFACYVSSEGAISGGTFEGTVNNEGAISYGTFEGDVNNTGGAISEGTFMAIVRNFGGTISDGIFASTVYNIDESTITGGDFTGAMVNNEGGAITGGTFTDAMVNNEGGTITGGVFDGFTMNSQSRELTITGAVDLDAEDALAPLTIALDGESIKSITVAESATFDAGSTTVPVPVTNNGGGEITGGTFSGDVENSGKITGGAFSNTVENSGTISGSITIEEYGNLNNNAGGTISGSITIEEYGKLNNNAGGTISSGTFTVSDDGGMANQGTITGSATFEISEYASLSNKGTISGGSFTGDVTNHYEGEITGGTFNSGSFVGNRGIISGGTFSSAQVSNRTSTSGKITGGTFGNGTVVTNRSSITGGDFRGATVTNYDDGTITGGDFRGATVTNDDDATVTGGTFDKFTVATDEDGERTITITGVIDMDSEDALHPLTIGLDAVKSVTIAAGGSFDAGNTTVSAHVFNYGGIGGGTFGSGVYNMGSITGAITLTSERALNNDGGTISGDITFTEGGRLDNSGEITGGAISGATVVNYSGGIISDGTFTDATVDNNGIIAYGDFRAAEVTNKDGSITGGMFKNCTLKDGELTITQNVDLREDALAPLSLAADSFAKLEIASGCAFNAGDNTVTVHVINHGTISGGTFENSMLDNSGTISGGTFNNGDVLNNPGGTISGGAFSGCTYNFGAITGGTFAEIVLTGASARVQGVDGSVPTLNGPIENGGSILQPCNFGENASVVENRGVIEVPATVNNIPQSLRYGEKTLEQLKKINPNDVWFEQAADGTQARVAESATVGLESRAYVSKDLPRVSAPAAKIDFDGEAVAVSLDATFALPQGLQRGELDVVFTYGDKSGRIEGAFANGNSATVSLSDLGEALGLALPAANGSGDASLRVTLTAAGQEDSYN